MSNTQKTQLDPYSRSACATWAYPEVSTDVPPAEPVVPATHWFDADWPSLGAMLDTDLHRAYPDIDPVEWTRLTCRAYQRAYVEAERVRLQSLRAGHHDGSPQTGSALAHYIGVVQSRLEAAEAALAATDSTRRGTTPVLFYPPANLILHRSGAWRWAAPDDPVLRLLAWVRDDDELPF